MGKYFGTDGIRGIANLELDPSLCYRVGKALGYSLKDESSKTIVIGHDGRRSKDMIMASLTAGITSMGFTVFDLGMVPTPAICYLTTYYKAACGIAISASHNAPKYNGIKIFSSTGLKLSDEKENDIEYYIDHLDEIEPLLNNDLGEYYRKDDSAVLYQNFLIEKNTISLEGYHIAIDSSNGATSSIAESLFKSLGAKVSIINHLPDGKNININAGSTHPEVIQEYLLNLQADVGFSFDGDGDRIIAVDEKGAIMDGDHILASLAKYLKSKGRLKNNALVGTIMSNLGLQKFCKQEGIHFVSTKVGDRYVLEEMLTNDYILGGEQSGHIILKEDNTTGDGLNTALKIMEMMVDEQKPLSFYNELMISYPQVLVNAQVNNEFKSNYYKIETIQEKINEIEAYFSEDGRVVIRPSGTEPLIRVMIEGEDLDIMEEKANELKDLLESYKGE